MLVGMAFTSPQIPTLVCDREKFHLFVFNPADTSDPDFQSFLSQDDGRDKVLLVLGIGHLPKVLSYETKIRSFIVFDGPKSLQKIGAQIIDCIQIGDGWKTKNFSISELDSILSQPTEEPEKIDVKEEESEMQDLSHLEDAEEDTLRAAVYKVLTTGTVPKGFVEALATYQCGMLQKRKWTFGYKKPAINGGADPVAIGELERYVEARYGLRVHRAVYCILVQKMSLDEAVVKFKANKEDVQFCLNVLPDKTYTEPDFHYKPDHIA